MRQISDASKLAELCLDEQKQLNYLATEHNKIRSPYQRYLHARHASSQCTLHPGGTTSDDNQVKAANLRSRAG